MADVLSLSVVMVMLALLCAAVVAVTTSPLPRALTVAMVLGLLSGAVGLGCIAVPSPTQNWQSGRCVVQVGQRVAVVVCGVALLCTGIDAADEETRRQRWTLLATAAAVFVAVWVVAIAHCFVRFRLRLDVSVCCVSAVVAMAWTRRCRGYCSYVSGCGAD
jgi:hypothetical protein